MTVVRPMLLVIAKKKQNEEKRYSFNPENLRQAFLRNNKNLLVYVIFYLIFSPDTWRILIGLLAAIIIGPKIVVGGNYSPSGQVVIWLMILALGYVLSAPVGRYISKKLTANFNRK